jgi:glycosyltransferase involved in cell wall biosynthesis
MPLISVIVPVFDAAKYLSRCIDSILSQNYIDFELILVNDGSTDDSLAICKRYADKDTRVIVVDKPNGGASSARNRGLDVAKGDFLCFVDADDYVSQNYLDDLYHDICRDNDIDLVMHGMIQIKGEKQIIISLPSSKTYKLDDGSFFKDVNLFKFCGPCCKLFRRDILSEYHIRFLECIIYSEDYDFFAKYLGHCNQVTISDKQNYFYVFHEGSVSTKINSFEKEYSGITNLFDTLSLLYERFRCPSLGNQVKDFLAYYMSRVLASVYVSPRPERFVRINHLKSIDNTFVQLYRDYFIPPTRYSRVFKALFVNKFYSLFDIASLLWRKKQEKR